MSLNGLDTPDIVQAFDEATSEPAGWFLVKYVSRDTVQLLARGSNGISEARTHVATYEEKSPVYGLIMFRRKRVIIKYVPEGTSRLLQARTAVHFNDVQDKYSPYDSVLDITTVEGLNDTALASIFPLHAGVSSSPLNQLDEITEDGEEPGSPVSSRPVTAIAPPPTKGGRKAALDRMAAYKRAAIPTIAVDSSALEPRSLATPSPDPGKSTVTTESSTPTDPERTTSTSPSISVTDKEADADSTSIGATPTLDHRSSVHSQQRSDDALSERSNDAPFSHSDLKQDDFDYDDLGIYEYKPKIKLGPRQVQLGDNRDANARSPLVKRGTAALPTGFKFKGRAADRGADDGFAEGDFGRADAPHETIRSILPLPPPVPETWTPKPRSTTTSYRSNRTLTNMSNPQSQEKQRLLKAVEMRKRQLKRSQVASANPKAPSNIPNAPLTSDVDEGKEKVGDDSASAVQPESTDAKVTPSEDLQATEASGVEAMAGKEANTEVKTSSAHESAAETTQRIFGSLANSPRGSQNEEQTSDRQDAGPVVLEGTDHVKAQSAANEPVKTPLEYIEVTNTEVETSIPSGTLPAETLETPEPRPQSKVLQREVAIIQDAPEALNDSTSSEQSKTVDIVAPQSVEDGIVQSTEALGLEAATTQPAGNASHSLTEEALNAPRASETKNITGSPKDLTVDGGTKGTDTSAEPKEPTILKTSADASSSSEAAAPSAELVAGVSDNSHDDTRVQDLAARLSLSSQGGKKSDSGVRMGSEDNSHSRPKTAASDGTDVDDFEMAQEHLTRTKSPNGQGISTNMNTKAAALTSTSVETEDEARPPTAPTSDGSDSTMELEQNTATTPSHVDDNALTAKVDLPSPKETGKALDDDLTAAQSPEKSDHVEKAAGEQAMPVQAADSTASAKDANSPPTGYDTDADISGHVTSDEEAPHGLTYLKSKSPSVITPEDNEKTRTYESSLSGHEKAKTRESYFVDALSDRSNRRKTWLSDASHDKSSSTESLALNTSDMRKKRQGIVEPVPDGAAGIPAASPGSDEVESFAKNATVHEATPVLVARSSATPVAPPPPSSSTTGGLLASSIAPAMHRLRGAVLPRAGSSRATGNGSSTDLTSDSKPSAAGEFISGTKKVGTSISQRIAALAQSRSREGSPNPSSPPLPSQSMPVSPGRLSRTMPFGKAADDTSSAPSQAYYTVHTDPNTRRESVSVTARIVRPGMQQTESIDTIVRQGDGQPEGYTAPALDSTSPGISGELFPPPRERAPSISGASHKSYESSRFGRFTSFYKSSKATREQPKPAAGADLSLVMATQKKAGMSSSTTVPASSADEDFDATQGKRKSRFLKRMSGLSTMTVRRRPGTAKSEMAPPPLPASYRTGGADDKPLPPEPLMANNYSTLDALVYDTPFSSSSSSRGKHSGVGGPSKMSPLPPLRIGDLNVQFPGSAIWKRRYVEISAAGDIVFAANENVSVRSRTGGVGAGSTSSPAAGVDLYGAAAGGGGSSAANSPGGATKVYALRSFARVFVPPVEDQDLAFSVVLELAGDEGEVVVACEDSRAQRELLNLLQRYHSASTTP